MSVRHSAWLLAFSLCALAGRASGDEQRSAQFPECPERLSEEAPNDATPPLTPPPVPCGEPGRSHYVYRRSADDKILCTLIEGPRGPQARLTLSYSQLVALLVADDPVPSELKMSREELEQLVNQLSVVKRNAEKYQDVNRALADGYVLQPGQLRNYVHLAHDGYLTDGFFDLSKPEMLVYEVSSGKYERLAGVVFMQRRRDVGDDHPEGFVGPLDHWQVRHNICKRPTTFPPSESSILEPDDCLRVGGSPVTRAGWRLYVWLWGNQGFGVFGGIR